MGLTDRIFFAQAETEQDRSDWIAFLCLHGAAFRSPYVLLPVGLSDLQGLNRSI